MASKLKGKASKSPFGDDDFIDSLFDDDQSPARGRPRRGGPLSRSSATDNIFSMLAKEVKKDVGDSEDSDVSAADPNDILKNMKDLDDMEADLFGTKKKPSAAPKQQKDSSVLESDIKPAGADLDDPLADLDDLLPDETKTESKSVSQQARAGRSAPSPAASPILKRETPKAAKKGGDLTFDDDDDKDDLIDALGFDSDKNTPKKKESALWPSKERNEPPQRVRTRLDEILENMTPTPQTERPATGERRVRPQSQERQQQEKAASLKESPLEDDLTFGSYQPTLVSTPEGRQSRRQSVRFSTEDVGPSTPEKRPKATTAAPSRHRNSVDWLGLKASDDQSFLEGDAKKTAASGEPAKAPSSPPSERKASLTDAKMAAAAPADKVTAQAKPEPSKSQKKEEEEEEEDWLAGALSRKKALTVSHSGAKEEDSLDLGEEADLQPIVSRQVTSQAPRRRDDSLASVKETSTFLGQLRPAAHSTPVRENETKQDITPPRRSSPTPSPSVVVECAPATRPPLPSTPTPPSSPPAPRAKVDLDPSRPPDHPPRVASPSPDPAAAAADSVSRTRSQPQYQPHRLPADKGSGATRGPAQASDEPPQQQPPSLGHVSAALPGSMWFPQQSQTTNTQQQVTFSAESLQKLLLQQMMQPQFGGGRRGDGDEGVLQTLNEQRPGDVQALQARVIQLEGQVKTLQLERDQSQMLLENVQQRHKQDMEIMEKAHKARVKQLEESAAQRDTQARQECEDLMERLATLTRSAEQERSDLQATYQVKLAQAQKDRDCEVERLRDLQRKSVVEMKKDHEDQIQRLKKLKDEEIEAVTSATSQTRSLSVTIEQFSSRLGELSSRMESTHEHTAHVLEEGTRHRDGQLRIMQDRLTQQQKAMEEERAYLKEIISRMDTQINEQQRQLEKERWKMTAEQAKAESTQKGLEEERRALSMQINMEREELERAKSALLEEQKSVMQQCAEERRKLAADWAHFHATEKQRRERAEREVSSLLEKREGSIISLAQEQADLKLHSAELKQKQMAVAQERETLDRLREELEREKERMSSTGVRLKTRVQEVEAFSKLAAEKHEEGERALREAKRVEAEHEARLRNIHAQTERLRQQEQRLLQERMRLTNLQKETERLRPDPLITSLPQTIPAILPDVGPMLPNLELAPTLNIPAPTSQASSESMALQASLALWKYSAEKDREYLLEEQIYLDNLKKKSYR